MKMAGFLKNRRWTEAAAMLAGVAVLAIWVGVGPAWGATGGEGPKGWLATDTYRVMNFVVLLAILVYLLRKPVSQALNMRIKEIKEQLNDLESRKEEAEKKLAEYSERFSDLNKEADKVVADYIRQGEEAKARILKEAEAAAEKLEAQAQRNIEHEFKQAKLKLQQDILEKALVQAEEIIKNRITGDDQERLVDEYLEKLDKVVA